MTASAAGKCSIKHFRISTKSYSRFAVVKYICLDSQKQCTTKLTLHLISLWRPIKGPVYDLPLTVCDRSTVDDESQTTAMDIVTSNLNEILAYTLTVVKNGAIGMAYRPTR